RPGGHLHRASPPGARCWWVASLLPTPATPSTSWPPPRWSTSESGPMSPPCTRGSPCWCSRRGGGRSARGGWRRWSRGAAWGARPPRARPPRWSGAGGPGFLPPPGDAQALTAQLEPLLADPVRAEAVGRAAAAEVRAHHAVAQEVAGLRALYAGLERGG